MFRGVRPPPRLCGDHSVPHACDCFPSRFCDGTIHFTVCRESRCGAVWPMAVTWAQPLAAPSGSPRLIGLFHRGRAGRGACTGRGEMGTGWGGLRVGWSGEHEELITLEGVPEDKGHVSAQPLAHPPVCFRSPSPATVQALTKDCSRPRP